VLWHRHRWREVMFFVVMFLKGMAPVFRISCYEYSL
jgi:hypothetical protein